MGSITKLMGCLRNGTMMLCPMEKVTPWDGFRHYALGEMISPWFDPEALIDVFELWWQSCILLEWSFARSIGNNITPAQLCFVPFNLRHTDAQNNSDASYFTKHVASIRFNPEVYNHKFNLG